MMDLMAFALELMSTILILVIKPFSLFKLACLFGLKMVFIIIHTWLELLKATIRVHMNIFWSIIIWTVALLSLPMRILTAIQRERTLELHLNELQNELENLLWDRKQLEGRLQAAIKECKIMELMLEELEEEHDKAILKIELLESQLQDLKNENLRLEEIQVKGDRKFKGQDDAANGQKMGIADNYGISYGVESFKSTHSGSGILRQDILMHRDAWEDESKSKSQDIIKAGPKVCGPIQSITHDIMSRNYYMNEVLEQQREVALSQSLFSAVLSLLVGIIIWEAKDPCVPLVVSLFTVVGMSLRSVVRFFSTIKNKPASDAVALLSLNWFILGTLTYPTLPRVVRTLGPPALNFGNWTLSWLGLSFY